MSKEFKCQPGILCKKADCCQARNTEVSMSVADYLRLANFLDKPVEEVWAEIGRFSLTEVTNSGISIVGLSMKHYPCTFLSEDYRCRVHQARPVGCVGFPFVSHIFGDESKIRNLETHFKCARNIKITQKQRSHYLELDRILYREAEAECKLFWNEGKDFISVPTPISYEVGQVLLSNVLVINYCQIRERFVNISPELVEFYRKTSQELKSLMEKID